jgi:hypothetical protein
MAKFQHVRKGEIADKIKSQYVLNKPIAKSIVDDIIKMIHQQDFVVVPRKEFMKLKEGAS